MTDMNKQSMYIREITNADLPQLYIWRNNDDFLNLCTNRRNKLSFTEFGYEINKDLRCDRLVQVVAVSSTGILMGTLYAYRFNEIDCTVYLTIYFSSEFRNHGYGVKALVLFGRYLFQKFNIFKLYVEVYSYNEKVIKVLERVGFKQEGCLVKHHLRGEERYDLNILALYSEDQDNPQIRRLIRRLT